jgi:predicted ATP-binding protein involved in virulence
MSENKNHPSNNMPFALKSIQIEHFQGITNLNIRNIPLDAQWIFLTGENSFGKTSLLRAIARVLAGDEENNHLKESIILAEGVFKKLPVQYQAIPKELNSYQVPLATYGAARFLMNGVHQQAEERNDKKTYSLFNDDARLINIERVLIDAYHVRGREQVKKGANTFDKLKSIFLKVIPKLADITVEYFEKERVVNQLQIRYHEKNDAGGTFSPVKLNDLAAGYRSILTMIGDMVMRLSENTNNSLDNLQGIVLIDEMDAHLHPKYQYDLPKLLSEAFPKVQFIVSTHSPIPILGVVNHHRAVVLTVNRTQEAGITAERLDDHIEIERLSANALLTSDIFGFKTIFARGATPATIEPFDDYKDIKAMNEMEKLLQFKQGFKKLNIKI